MINDIIKQQVKECILEIRKANILIFRFKDNKEGSIIMSNLTDITGLNRTETDKLLALGWYINQIFTCNRKIYIGIKRVNKI